jgi:tripartite ATP-independent transporter DctM subunit
MLIIGLMAKPRGFPRAERADLKEIVAASKAAFLPLMAPVIIIGGILSGLFTPTEASVVVSLYALFLGFLYKDLRLKDLPKIFWDSIKGAAGLLFIMAAANFFGWFTMYERIPDSVIASLASLSASPASVMAIILAVILALGLFLEGNAIFFITIPIFLPIAKQYGLDLVNLGVVMTLMIMIGNLTPPVGMCLFAVSSFSKVKVLDLAKECFPYIVGIFAVTVLIAYVPAIATFLPNLVMGAE